MIIIIPTIKYGFTYYDTFTMGVFSNYHGYFYQCMLIANRIVFLKRSVTHTLKKTTMVFTTTSPCKRVIIRGTIFCDRAIFYTVRTII